MNYIRAVSIDIDATAGTYLADVPAIRNFPRASLETPSPVTFFVGENGVGKSTLMEAIAVAAGFNPEGGGKNFRFHTRESHSPLWKFTTLIRNPVGKWRDGYFLRAESYYNLATNVEELDNNPADASPRVVEAYGGRSLHEQSHGESFLTLLRERLGGDGLYIFDEPEAGLSPTSQLVMLSEIRRLTKRGSQFLISTHSPILTAYPGATIYAIAEDGIRRQEQRETENYVVTRRFLNDPERFFAEFFDLDEA